MRSRKAYHSSTLAALPFELRLQIYSYVFVNTTISPVHTKDVAQCLNDIFARITCRHPKLQSLTLALREQPKPRHYYPIHNYRYIKFTANHLRDPAFLAALRESLWELCHYRCWQKLLNSQHMPFFAHQLRHVFLGPYIIDGFSQLNALPMLESVVLGRLYSHMDQDTYNHAPDEVFIGLVMDHINSNVRCNWSQLKMRFKLSFMVRVNVWRGGPFRSCLIDHDNRTVQRNLPKLFLNDCVCCPPRGTPLHVRFRYLRIRLQGFLLVLPPSIFLLALCAVMVSLETKMVEHLPGKAPRTPLRWLGDPILSYLIGRLGSERCLLLKEYWAVGTQVIDSWLGRAWALSDPVRRCARSLLGSPQDVLLHEYWISCMKVLHAWLHREWYLGDRILAYAGSLLESPQGLRLREHWVYCTGGVNAWLHRVWVSVDRRMCPSWL